jgi:hypothetical protein
VEGTVGKLDGPEEPRLKDAAVVIVNLRARTELEEVNSYLGEGALPPRPLHADVPSLHDPDVGLEVVRLPAFCVIAQGSKEVLLGDDCYRYDADRYLITAAALPTATRVTGASEERPYLGVVLGLDPALVGSVMGEAGHLAPREHAAVRAFEVSSLDAGLLDAVVRLVGLLDSPADEARFLRPLVTREIVFRLLKGEQGNRLRQIAVLGGHSHRIARALERLRKDFDRPLRIEDMSGSSG